MLEEESWTDAPDCVFPNTCNKTPVTDVSSLASDNTGTLHHCFGHKNIDTIDRELYQDGPILDNRKASVGESSCSFPLGPVSPADDLSFFHNNNVEDANYLLYYSWSEIGNFEEVDMMFSCCESTFGLGAGNEDDLGWFSSLDAIEGSGEWRRIGIRF